MFPPTYDRVVVYQQTKEYYKNLPIVESIVNRRHTEVTSKEMESLQYKYPKSVVAPVLNKDCINVAMEYVERGFNPILLNMSSWRRPGGGVETGAGAQEEELFRRSNYFKHLHKKYYPFKFYDTIISKGVEFFRNGSDKGYTILNKPFKIDCIAAPALRNPQLTRTYDDFGNEEDIFMMEQKIRSLLFAAAKNGNDCIILSAWGCGAFGCPPKGVARLFKKVLKEFTGVFKETPFAITGNNFLPFYEEFKTI
jgi:uncharacterized protein (TIGR02452 family)